MSAINITTVAANVAWIPLPENQLYNDKITLSDFATNMLNKVTLRPSYQRKYKWARGQFVKFITHVWKRRGMLQSIVLHKLPNDEFECIDGQHRLTTIKHFITSTPIDELPEKDNMVYIDLQNSNNDPIALFYKSTEHTENWAKRTKRVVMYLNDNMPDHLSAFHNMIMPLSIVSQMEIQDRKDTFTDLQQGVKNSNSDVYRNLDIELVKNIDAFLWTAYNNEILPLLATKPEKYGIQWLIRFYHLSKNAMLNDNATTDSSADVAEAGILFKKSADGVDLSDAALTACLDAYNGKSGKTITKNQTRILAYDKATFDRFLRDINRLKRLCKGCSEFTSKFRFPPIIMHSLYNHIIKMNDEEYIINEPIIMSWMKQMPKPNAAGDFVSDIHKKISDIYPKLNVSTLWERKINGNSFTGKSLVSKPNIDIVFEIKSKIYCLSSQLLREYTAARIIDIDNPSVNKPKRVKMPEQRTNNIWDKYYGKDAIRVKCYVCDTYELERLKRSTWVMAHIIAFIDDGESTEDNMIPICVACNTDMRDENLYEFQKKLYPNVYAKYNL